MVGCFRGEVRKTDGGECGERSAEGKGDVDSAMQKTKVVRIVQCAVGVETPHRKLAAEAA